MIPALPLQLMTLYQELVDSHLARPLTAEATGAPYQRTLRGKVYWYATERSGRRVVQRYLGPDNEDTRAKVEALGTRRIDKDQFEQSCGSMVAQLRAARLPTLDATTGRTLGFLAANGLFDLGGTLVGTMAFRLYDAELGRRITRAAPALTEDIDLASFEKLSMALNDPPTPRSETLGQLLNILGLKPVPALDPKGRTARWRGIAGRPVLDFLAPSFGEQEDLVWLDALGVWAQSLHFLGYLLADPIPAVALYRHGVLVRVPKPERFAIHKLIVAQARSGPDISKRRKDLAQAAALIVVLAEDRPTELRAAFAEARDQGPRWRQALEQSLTAEPEITQHLRRASAL